MEATDKDMKAVAVGAQPVWEETFEHPEHGPLRFTAKLPTALRLTRHSVEMDNMLADLYGDPSIQTQIMVAAIAGVKSLIERPVISESRRHDEDTGRTVIEKDFYDPEAELHEAFLADVWRSYSIWRSSFVNKVGQLKNSSGETNGSGSNEPSTATTVSPSTTPA